MTYRSLLTFTVKRDEHYILTGRPLVTWGKALVKVYTHSVEVRRKEDEPSPEMVLGLCERAQRELIKKLLWGWSLTLIAIGHWPVLRASEGTLSRWSRLLLQSLTPTNLHWARVVGYGPFSLWVIHKEDLCPSSGDINRLMMMMMVDQLLRKNRLLYGTIRLVLLVQRVSCVARIYRAIPPIDYKLIEFRGK
jgi:hypothetical protein